MKQTLILVAVLSLPFGVAGTCGSVLKGYHPTGWPTNHMGGWDGTFGAFQVHTGGLIDHGGSSGRFKITNRGDQATQLVGIDLIIAGVSETWEPTPGVSIAAGATSEANPQWKRTIGVRECETVLRFVTGDKKSEIKIPFSRT